MAWVSVAAVVVAALVTGAIYFRPAPAEVASVRFSVGPPEKGNFSEFADFLAVSPDGTKLAFIAPDATGKTAALDTRLWIRPQRSRFRERIMQLIPFGRPTAGFSDFGLGAKLKKIAVSGGPAQTLVENVGANATGTWNRDGVIVFARSAQASASLHRVSAAGGAATPLFTLDAERQENGHWSGPISFRMEIISCFSRAAQSRKITPSTSGLSIPRRES